MPALGVNVIIFDDSGRILLTRREDFDVWCVPSGKVDPGESIGEAARRETREECGLEVALTCLVGVYSRPGEDDMVGHVATFAARPIGGSLRPQPGETTELAWFDPADLPDDILVMQRLRIQHAITAWRSQAPGGSVSWACRLDWPYPPGTDRATLYRLCDESGLSRREFHRRHLIRPLAPGLVLDAAPPDYWAWPAAPRPTPQTDAQHIPPVLPGPERLDLLLNGASVAVLHEGKLLLTPRKDFDVWCLPGGMTDGGESLAETARRELLEETGLHIALTGLVGIYSKLRWLDRGVHVYIFSARVVGGALHSQPEEVLESRFFTPAELPPLEDFFFAHHQMAQDAFHGVCGGRVWTQRVPYPFPSLTRAEIYARRDASGLSRAEFYRRYNPPPEPGQEVDELEL